MSPRVEIYSTNYGHYDIPQRQPLPVKMFSDESHPLSFESSKLNGAWWKFQPGLACPDAEVTIYIDGNMEIIKPSLVNFAVAMLGDADAVFVQHSSRSCIYEEAKYARKGVKYDGLPLEEQAASYSPEHPRNWGLFACGFMIRRNNERIAQLGHHWWLEMRKWAALDQLSFPPILRTSDVRWKTITEETRSQLVRIHKHAVPDKWRI